MAPKKFLPWGLLSFFNSIALGAPLGLVEKKNIDLAVDLENWMTLLPNDLRKVPISNLAIPGSHDSFTADITPDSEISPDGLKLMQKLGKFFKHVIANWSKTQEYNVIEQLKAGIRYFDLRLCRNSLNGSLNFCHAMYSSEVKSVLKNIANYLDNHREEVVILDCQHFYNFTVDTHKEVIDFFKSTFGKKLIPREDNMTRLTLENLASKNQQVLAIYRDPVVSEHDFLWPTESFLTPWYDTLNTTYLIDHLDAGLITRSPYLGYVSQLVLTPAVIEYLENLWNTLKQKCAIEFEDLRTYWISRQKPGIGGVNVIIADFIELSSDLFSKTVINLNQKLLDPSVYVSTFHDKIKRYLVNIKQYFLVQ